MTGWYIEALDPRGGYAFASRRESDLYRAAPAALDVQTVFFRPPSFQPEAGPTRAAALAATRGSFQAGVLHDGEETAFASLDDVIEYVRRIYLSSVGSGGDGGGGAAGEGHESPLPPFPWDAGGPGEHAEIISKELLHLVGQFANASKKIKLGAAGKPFDWSAALQGTKSSDRSALSLIHWASVVIAYEKLRSLPLKPDSGALLAWLEEAKHIGVLIAQLGLTGRVATQLSRREDVQKLLMHFVGAWSLEGKLGGASSREFWLICGLLSGFADLRWFEMFYVGWVPYSLHMKSLAEKMDYADILDRVTLPGPVEAWLSKHIRTAVSRRVTLFQLLMTVIANPILLEEIKPPSRDAVVALILLASVHLATCGRAQIPIQVREDVFSLSQVGHQLEAAALTQAFEAGIEWLGAALPRCALPIKLEQDIIHAARLTYSAERPIFALS